MKYLNIYIYSKTIKYIFNIYCILYYTSYYPFFIEELITLAEY